MKWELIDCKYGDMIRVRCGSVFHYGIYISDEEIIEFGYPPTMRDRDSDNIVVNCVDIDTFSCGNFIEVGVCDKKELKKKFDSKKIAENAKNRLGESGYDFIKNNCEHFAYECYFGFKYSSQEEEAKSKWRSVLEKGRDK